MKRSLRSWLWRVPIEQEVDEELALHVEMRRREGRPLDERDIEQVRHAYPGLSAAQQGSWQTFFDRVRNLKATLSVTSLNVGGASADATVSGVYEYDNASTGRAERRPVTFHATLARAANGWRITAIR